MIRAPKNDPTAHAWARYELPRCKRFGQISRVPLFDNIILVGSADFSDVLVKSQSDFVCGNATHPTR